MPRNDIVIYAPEAAALYESRPRETGGAELQTALLARALGGRGKRVAHVVFPLDAPGEAPAGVEVVQRAAWAGGGPLGQLREAVRVWRGLWRADGRVQVFRMSSPALGIVAAYCRLRNRRLVFAGANNFDFTFERMPGAAARRLYSFGVRTADAVVVQTSEQAELARAAFPGLRRIEEIASFAEPAAPAGEPLAFVWIGRLVDYKQPLDYLALAEALPEARFRMVAMETGETAPELSRELRERSARLPNLELLPPRGRAELGAVLDEAVAVVSTSGLEGMPNVFLEGWARGVPALSLRFDPDGRIAAHGLGHAAGGSFERFRDAADELWRERGERAELSERVRGYIERTHSEGAVGARWAVLLDEVSA
jgi:glycosyltransferase involved in cell wall biosynthesis